MWRKGSLSSALRSRGRGVYFVIESIAHTQYIIVDFALVLVFRLVLHCIALHLHLLFAFLPSEWLEHWT